MADLTDSMYAMQEANRMRAQYGEQAEAAGEGCGMGEPVHALGCYAGVSMGDRVYPAWRYAGKECACIDYFQCPAPECVGILRVTSGPRCTDDVRTVVAERSCVTEVIE